MSQPVAGPIIAIIPARGGSKGVLRKNVRLLAGRPLIAWSIDDAFSSRRVDRVFVSTEDQEIRARSMDAGAEVIDRPVELAADTTSSEDVLIHALDWYVTREGKEPALIVFLQATCPVRTGEDIDEAVALLESKDADSLLSVCPSHAFLWRERDGLAEAVNYDWSRRPRRQDMEPQYRENGSIYVFKPSLLRSKKNRLGGKMVLYKMSEHAGLDIDSEEDLAAADLYFRQPEGHHS